MHVGHVPTPRRGRPPSTSTGLRFTAYQRRFARTQCRGNRGVRILTHKCFVHVDERHVELRPESTNPAHRTLAVDLARTELHIDGVAVGALIGQGYSPMAAEPAA